MAFIKVTDTSDHIVYVNIDHIVTVEHEGNHSRIDLDADHIRDKYVLVKDSPEQIMDLINEATNPSATLP
jgi:hypothetical protein